MTDYKQLCAELVEQLDDALYFTFSSETRRHMMLLTRKARAALAEPEPPSLKEQALETLLSMQIEPVVIDGVNVNADVMSKYDIIRRALQQLPD